jgi:hypothetical protein
MYRRKSIWIALINLLKKRIVAMIMKTSETNIWFGETLEAIDTVNAGSEEISLSIQRLAVFS